MPVHRTNNNEEYYNERKKAKKKKRDNLMAECESAAKLPIAYS